MYRHVERGLKDDMQSERDSWTRKRNKIIASNNAPIG